MHVLMSDAGNKLISPIDSKNEKRDTNAVTDEIARISHIVFQQLQGRAFRRIAQEKIVCAGVMVDQGDDGNQTQQKKETFPDMGKMRHYDASCEKEHRIQDDDSVVQETVQCHKVEKRILRPVGEENRAECAGHEQTDADLSQCLGMAQKLAEIQETGQITQVQGESVAVHFSCQRQNDILSDRQKEGGERRDSQKLFCVDS